jgi:hypothetical protein
MYFMAKENEASDQVLIADFKKEITASAIRELEKYGEATAQHLKSYARLDEISKFETKNDPHRNLHQQAGFSAEAKEVARRNEDFILKGKKTRYERTDELGQVNHQIYDLAETNLNGQALSDSKGDFVGGAQMKNHMDIKKYRDHWKKNFEKYESAKLLIPSDQYPVVMDDWSKQQIILEKQTEELIKRGDTKLAAKKQEEIDRIKNARRRAKPSKVSTSDAMEARKSPILSVGKDVLRVAHKAGAQAAGTGAAMGGGIGVLRYGYEFINDKKTAAETSLSILTDTGRSAISAYASGATTAMLSGALQEASGQIVRNLGKGNTPSMIVQTSTVLAKGVLDCIAGKITTEQMIGQISREGMTLVTSLTGSNFGAILGTFCAPGIGTVVGGVIGGMIASMLSGGVYSTLKRSVHDLELSNEQREKTQEFCAYIISQHKEYRRQMDAIFDQFFFEKRKKIKSAFNSIADATMRGESIRGGLEDIAQAFGKQLAFKNGAEIRAQLRSGKILEF